MTSSYGYDSLNRLTSFSSGATSASYSYNGDGLRVAKTIGGATTRYAWHPAGLGHVLSDGTSNYAWDFGLLGQVTSAGLSTYARGDAQWTIGMLTDGTGAVAGREQFDAYGGSRALTGAHLPFGYTGEQTDDESGLVYLCARFYGPKTGRFLSQDAFGGSASDPRASTRTAMQRATPRG